MLKISFSRYDEIDEAAEKTKVSSRYKLPDVEYISDNLNSENNLKAALVAFYNAKNKDYKKAIQNIFLEQIMFLDEDDDSIITPGNKKLLKKKAGSRNYAQIIEDVQNMSFQPDEDFCPDIKQLEEFVKKRESDIGFLFWLLSALQQRESLTEDEYRVINWIKNYFK